MQIVIGYESTISQLTKEKDNATEQIQRLQDLINEFVKSSAEDARLLNKQGKYITQMEQELTAAHKEIEYANHQVVLMKSEKYESDEFKSMLKEYEDMNGEMMEDLYSKAGP